MFLGPLLKAKMMQGRGDPFLSLHGPCTSQLIDLIMLNACVQYEQYGGCQCSIHALTVHMFKTTFSQLQKYVYVGRWCVERKSRQHTRRRSRRRERKYGSLTKQYWWSGTISLDCKYMHRTTRQQDNNYLTLVSWWIISTVACELWVNHWLPKSNGRWEGDSCFPIQQSIY